jgi:hypothetical protein
VSNIGTVAGWVAVVGVFSVAWLQWRGGGSTAIQVLTATNEVLERRVHELTSQVNEQQRTIGELRARTDITLALQPLIDAVLEHERMSATRQEKTSLVLDAIASRLHEPLAHEPNTAL